MGSVLGQDAQNQTPSLAQQILAGEAPLGGQTAPAWMDPQRQAAAQWSVPSDYYFPFDPWGGAMPLLMSGVQNYNPFSGMWGFGPMASFGPLRGLGAPYFGGDTVQQVAPFGPSPVGSDPTGHPLFMGNSPEPNPSSLAPLALGQFPTGLPPTGQLPPSLPGSASRPPALPPAPILPGQAPGAGSTPQTALTAAAPPAGASSGPQQGIFIGEPPSPGQATWSDLPNPPGDTSPVFYQGNYYPSQYDIPQFRHLRPSASGGPASGIRGSFGGPMGDPR